MNKEGYWIFDTHAYRGMYCCVDSEEEVHKRLREFEERDRKNFGGPPDRPRWSYTVIKGTKIKI